MTTTSDHITFNLLDWLLPGNRPTKYPYARSESDGDYIKHVTGWRGPTHGRCPHRIQQDLAGDRYCTHPACIVNKNRVD